MNIYMEKIHLMMLQVKSLKKKLKNLLMMFY